MSATVDLMTLDKTKVVKDSGQGFDEFFHLDCVDIGNPTGIAIVEGELLYGLVRMIKPLRILETGTNIGTSAHYMGLAIMDNKVGHIDTIEHNTTVADRAIKKIKEMGLDKIITVHTMRIEDFEVDGIYDMLWLDSELAIRFGELIRFFPNVRNGGIIGMHDIGDLSAEAFGGVPDQMRIWLRCGILRVITLPYNHGVTLFQKCWTDDHVRHIQSGRII